MDNRVITQNSTGGHQVLHEVKQVEPTGHSNEECHGNDHLDGSDNVWRVLSHPPLARLVPLVNGIEGFVDAITDRFLLILAYHTRSIVRDGHKPTTHRRPHFRVTSVPLERAVEMSPQKVVEMPPDSTNRRRVLESPTSRTDAVERFDMGDSHLRVH